MGLLDDISKLTTPAAELPDLEDDNFDESSKTKLKATKGAGISNFDFEKDEKYAGKKVSRAELFGDISEIRGLQKKANSDSEDGSDSEESGVDDEDDEEASDASVNGDSEDQTIDVDDDEVVDDEEQEEEEEVVEDEEDDVDDKEDNEENDVVKNLQMKLMSIKDDADKSGDKAEAVRNQRQVWDDLMYANIRMHALLNSVNQMPRGDARKQLLKASDEKTSASLQNALANMAKLRSTLQKAIGTKNASEDVEDDDEEIPSDDEIIPSDDEGVDDEEEEGEGEEEEEDVKKSSESGTSVKTLKKNLEKRDTAIEKFRGATITKWYNRTKLLSSKSTDFSVFEKGSILGQIQKVLSDEEKLLKKVRTNRSGKPRVGSAPSDVIDNEIFDDSDFYQVLLKQMLESRSQNNQQDGADMTRSYMELQTMFNQKKKRDVSQLSSKDRRLKYEPIAKLINFYPSKPSVVTWSHESRNELFKSLFT